jgi:hypothetical protein
MKMVYQQDTREMEEVGMEKSCHPERSEGPATGSISGTRSFAALRMTYFTCSLLFCFSFVSSCLRGNPTLARLRVSVPPWLHFSLCTGWC